MATRTRRRTIVATREGLWSGASKVSWRWRTRTAWWCVGTVDGAPRQDSDSILWSFAKRRN